MAELHERFAKLTCAHVADACLRLHIPVRTVSLTAVFPARIAGRVLPVQHVGSVDIFLEAFGSAAPGDVLVVDNAARRDEACAGDLVAAEAKAAGLSGLVLWGLHRDTVDIKEIGLPVYSLGAMPTGPLRLDPLPSDALEFATVGEWTVTRDDVVLGDEDGITFVPADRVDELFGLAESIRDTERRQSELIKAGTTLREQLGFDAYLAARAERPGLTFREHLRGVGGAIEE
ncbi:regulator of RNase E activity RraA [Kribbella voronezhensis]|uniref:Putative 4-hydroxy-4-methyl-2-oxoglutarate aldolase n=1 Tax=Kribbella voronezhensis TaxID=2512212 RepID=A0A4R7TF52_9ACTN|nr:RraA family protein [Kribbella voronezhensis]TDU90805.1 regulator of RNase E activity RraA [Kribbella voronezhensis]